MGFAHNLWSPKTRPLTLSASFNTIKTDSQRLLPSLSHRGQGQLRELPRLFQFHTISLFLSPAWPALVQVPRVRPSPPKHLPSPISLLYESRDHSRTILTSRLRARSPLFCGHAHGSHFAHPCVPSEILTALNYAPPNASTSPTRARTK